jgi:hypothetical protein
MKTYGRSGCMDPRFLDLGTNWWWQVSFTPLPLYPLGKSPPPPVSYWIGGRVDPRDGLDDMEKLKFLTLPGLELGPRGGPARSQSLYRLRYRRSPFMDIYIYIYYFVMVVITLYQLLTKIPRRAMRYNWLNIREFSSVRLPTQDVTYSQRCFRKVIPNI